MGKAGNGLPLRYEGVVRTYCKRNNKSRCGKGIQPNAVDCIKGGAVLFV